MNEKPILFSTPMVRAIMEDRKTHTRRVIASHGKTPIMHGRDKLYKMVDTLNGKPFFGGGFYKDSDVFVHEGRTLTDAVYYKSRYQPGDTLWVRETWCRGEARNGDEKYIYKADIEPLLEDIHQWKPSIHMPRKAARLFLEVTDVRVERVQDIGFDDVIAEGITLLPESYNDPDNAYYRARNQYKTLWDTLNAKRGFGWTTNPWVWVYEFKRLEAKP